MKKAIVLLSGGLDSATCLALALAEGYACYTLAFDYGQRHRAELSASEKISKALGAVEHRLFKLSLDQFQTSSLTNTDLDVLDFDPLRADAVPNTYVPARNTIFLSIALGFAETFGAQAIFIGAHAEDYSGYPDCRPEFFQAFENLARVATQAGVEGEALEIRAPLLRMKKSHIIEQGVKHGVDYAMTVSCYRSDSEGRACGTCDSCHYRQKGFQDAGILDPTRYQ